MRRFHFNERPDSFEIDPQHQLGQQLVFAGLGRCVGGAHFHDSSLYGNTGTLTNMDPTTDWGRDIGRATLDFDGSDDFVLLPNIATFHAPSVLSVATWMYHDSGGAAAYQRIATGGVTGTTRDWFVVYNPSNNYLCIGDSDGFKYNAINLEGGWHSIVGTANGLTLTLWVDGISLSLSTLGTWNGFSASSEIPAIGRGTQDGGYTLNSALSATLADPMIWSRVLSPSEISALADPSNVMLSLGGSDPGLLRYRRKWWPVGSAATNYYIPNKMRYYRSRRVCA